MPKMNIVKHLRNKYINYISHHKTGLYNSLELVVVYCYWTHQGFSMPGNQSLANTYFLRFYVLFNCVDLITLLQLLFI